MRNASKNCSKRKGEKSSKTLTDINGGEAEVGNKGFYACYLLTSLSPRHKGQTYIGFTVNPKRRIRQHNGEITSGATRTKKKRPWEMTLCIYGFPTQVAALQFEWAWQHPTESLAVRNAACSLKSLNGLANKIKLAFTMLTLHTWQSMDVTVNFFSTRYMSHVADCPSLPKQMKVQFGSMDDLPCYSSGSQSLHNDENDWDLDPQECSGSDGVEDLSRGSSAVGNRHCFDAIASSTENQADKESQQSQEYDFQKHCFDATSSFTRNQSDKESQQSQESDVFEPRDSFFVIEDDDFQNQIDQELNTTCIATKDSGCNLVEGRSPLGKGGATDETQSDPVKQIEVIDLSTPSPDYRNNTHSKKRKVGSARTEVIDLTRSSDFVEL